jgi:hypothetical protein
VTAMCQPAGAGAGGRVEGDAGHAGRPGHE